MLGLRNRQVSMPLRRILMSLAMWFVAMFLLGLAAMGLCYLFLDGCEHI
jgi:hypothetical protein